MSIRLLTLATICLLPATDAHCKKNYNPMHLLSDSSSSSSSESGGGVCDESELVFIADIKILGRSGKSCLLLENNIVYQPLKKKYKDVSLTWQVGDTIRLYSILPDDGAFFMLNFTTGNTIKATVKCI